MTLTRRMALLIASMLLLALGGALAIHTFSARQALQQQQDMRNRDAAASLALALSQQKGDVAAMRAVATAQFDQGHYRRIELVRPAGQEGIRLQQAAAPVRAPGWFVSLLPLQVAAGTALVNSGWTDIGTLHVEAHTGWAQESLWRASASTAGLLAGLAALAAALATLMLRAWQRPLEATVAQAQALEQGRFVQAELPGLPELRHLTGAMNATVRRLREMFAHQAEQVAYLQRRAQLDPLTGLPLRQHCQQAMDRRLAQRDGMGLSIIVVRVAQLDQINQQHGHEATDAVLKRSAEVLIKQWQAEPDTLAGRLSGSDFVLCLPVPGMASELAPGLWRGLRDAVAAVVPNVKLQLAALEAQTGPSVEGVLAQANLALQRAEAGNGLHIEPLRPGATAVADLSAWQAQIGSALQEGRVQLGEFEVQDAQGQLIHLECPLRLQLDPHGAYLPAARWLAMARRCGLTPQVDQAAIGLALAASAADGRPRAVNLALSSLSAPGMIAAVAAQLQAAPQAARLLAIEWVDGGGRGDWQAAEHAISAWQSLGVRMGVEHAGGAPEQLARLRDLGVQYVKVDGGHLRGAADDPDVGAYARSLVGLIQLLGLQALAEGIDRADDLGTLWQLGFDGATGSALRVAGRLDLLPLPKPGTGLPRAVTSAA